MVSVRHGLTSEMKKAGASISWVKEHAIKGPEDYKVLAHIFGNLTLKPSYERYNAWRSFVGDDGLAVAQGLGIGCTSPMHFIQKTFLDATEFYLHHHDYKAQMAALVEALEGPYNQLIDILAGSAVDAVLWSANVDDMITYPALYEEHFMPWCHKAADKLSPQGIFIISHPDGENEGLMDLIAKSRVDVADAVTPYPMTKIKLEEYYERWCRPGHLTIHGGIPEMLLLEESTTWDDLKDYMDNFFKVVAPGSRLVASIGDTTPPNADFDRLDYIGERMDKEGALPLDIGAYRPEKKPAKAPPPAPRGAAPATPEEPIDIAYARLTEDVLEGDQERIVVDVEDCLDKGYSAQDILNKGLLPAMELIGFRFTDGTVFIPEVVLSARAMNDALEVLDPYLVADGRTSIGKVMIGTVNGDLHDIGKNLVVSMIRGVGYDVVDLGVNIKAADFVAQVAKHKPDVLGLSALLTTTMPQVREVIAALDAAGLRDKVKVIIGGAPVNQKFADDAGADGFAQDAAEAVNLVKRLLAA
jgi:5-methyltetrahydrofolate--homocysteine methyltransferase